MNHQNIIMHLRVNLDIFRGQLQGISDKQARWKPGEDKWSILEVINHLHDEEIEDFKKRLGLTLNTPDAPWPPVDPERWVVERNYNERSLVESLSSFLNERESSLLWLNGLASPDWRATHRHPKMGPMTAELILVNWLAHDLFHIRQLNDLHFAWLKRTVAPVSLEYSGW